MAAHSTQAASSRPTDALLRAPSPSGRRSDRLHCSHGSGVGSGGASPYHRAMNNAITWVDGTWKSGNPPLMGAVDHSTWLSSVAFDGARAIRGAAPDLDLHCMRAIRSAELIGMKPKVAVAEIMKLAWEGIARMPRETDLYIRPLF